METETLPNGLQIVTNMTGKCARCGQPCRIIYRPRFVTLTALQIRSDCCTAAVINIRNG